MAEVSLTVGGRSYAVRCRDGDEPRLHRLAEAVDRQIEIARRSAPGINEVRSLLFAALFLADELADARKAAAVPPPAPPQDDTVTAETLEHLAFRIERLAERLAPERSVS